MVIPGCLKQDGGESSKKKGKKVALVDRTRGIPTGDQIDEGKFWDQGVEAFVLEEDDLDMELGAFDAEKEMQLARADIEKEEPTWKEDAEFEKENFESIHFDFDSHTVREDQKSTLAFDIEQARKAVEDGAITVAGHSDSHFVSELYNIAKSEKRAREVAAHLEEAGIPAEKIKVVAYGDKQRAVDVAGKEEKNRRVELIKLTESV